MARPALARVGPRVAYPSIFEAIAAVPVKQPPRASAGTTVPVADLVTQFGRARASGLTEHDLRRLSAACLRQLRMFTAPDLAAVVAACAHTRWRDPPLFCGLSTALRCLVEVHCKPRHEMGVGKGI